MSKKYFYAFVNTEFDANKNVIIFKCSFCIKNKILEKKKS